MRTIFNKQLSKIDFWAIKHYFKIMQIYFELEGRGYTILDGNKLKLYESGRHKRIFPNSI